MKFGLDVSSDVTVAAQGAGLASVLTINDVATGHLSVTLNHQGLFDGILNALNLELFAADGATEKTLNNSRCHRQSGGAIFRREGVIARDIAVGLEGTLDSETDALLVEGFGTTITLAYGEFTTLHRVDTIEG